MKRIFLIAGLSLSSMASAFGNEPCCGQAVVSPQPRTTFIDPAAMPAPAAISAVTPYSAVEPVYEVPAPRPVVVYRPVLDVAPMPAAVYTGRGLLGQPKLYVPGQPVRNFFRYLGP